MTHGWLLPHGCRWLGNGTPIACGRSPTGAAPIDNTTFYATLIINSNGEYMQPRWFFCINCHGGISRATRRTASPKHQRQVPSVL
jgi:hypothetical protein